MLSKQVMVLLFLSSLLWSAAFWLYTRKNTALSMAFYDLSGYSNEPSESDSLKIQGVQQHYNITMPVTMCKPLGPCPNTPPNLLGPLHVEFDLWLTMDEVRKEYTTLQEGGRYKPPDCISLEKVAIIIPFRNRHQHLKHWLYYLHPILQRQQLNYGVYVINQDGDGVFNRAKLMNVGFAEALKEYDYGCFVFSDTDLIPMNDRNLYRCFDKPRHLSVAVDKFNFKLPYSNIFGGVISLSKYQYLKINGFSNNYWGWGGEDDDIYNRIIFNNMSICRPDLETGKYKMIKHHGDFNNEPNPMNTVMCKNTRETMKKDGFNSLIYTVKTIVKDALYTLITVDVHAPLERLTKPVDTGLLLTHVG